MSVSLQDAAIANSKAISDATNAALAAGQKVDLTKVSTASDVAKNSSVYDPKAVSNPSGISSSSTVTTNNNINTNTSSATNTANGVKPALSDAQNKIISTYGLGEDYVRGLSSDAMAQFALNLRADDIAQTQATQAKTDLDAQYKASLAQQNADYALHTSDLATQRQKDLDTAKATAAQLNPYSGGNTDQDNYTGAINVAYDKLQTELDSQAAMAKAALDAGNMKAYADINNNMANIKETGISNIQAMLSDLNKTAIQQSQFQQTEADKAATLKQNDELKNTSLYQAALQNLPQPKDLVGLPENFDTLTPEQKARVQGEQAYEVGIQAGLTPQAVWSGIRNAAGSAYKQQAADAKQQQIAIAQANSAIAANRAQAYMLTAQANLANKQAGAIDAQTVASLGNGAFLSAFQNAQSAGKYTKDKNSTTLSTLAYNIQNGDVNNAKTTLINYALSGGSATDQRMYQTLQGIPSLVSSISTKINALPKSQQQGFLTGSINDIANKFGQSKDPKLQEIAFEMGHLQKNYVAPIYGMRAAASTGDSIFNNLFPSGTDSKTLSLVKLTALTNTAKDTVNAQVQARIGTQPYQTIFGSSGALGSSGGIAPKGQTQNINGHTYTSDGSQWVLTK